MRGSSHRGKASRHLGPSAFTRSQTSKSPAHYCECSPLSGSPPPSAPTRDAATATDSTDIMAEMETQLGELRKLFLDNFKELRTANATMQAAIKEPHDDSPVKAKLESFQGYETQDVKRWLMKFESRLALRHKKSDSQVKAADLAFHLAGPAETWYYNLDDDVRKDYAAVRAALLKRYSNSDLDWRLRQQLALSGKATMNLLMTTQISLAKLASD